MPTQCPVDLHANARAPFGNIGSLHFDIGIGLYRQSTAVQERHQGCGFGPGQNPIPNPQIHPVFRGLSSGTAGRDALHRTGKDISVAVVETTVGSAAWAELGPLKTNTPRVTRQISLSKPSCGKVGNLQKMEVVCRLLTIKPS